ncbi:MAG: 16S rRNA (guanine(527)-N(7))-methyltransferase RsmG [Chloroflexi bacterium]|nr:16S rRNA (guanine(527)-N(7))-methyltransferase RsmG [Chloroflexota bacterium]
MELLVRGARELGLELTPAQVATFQVYYEELLLWNQRHNLTAITDLAEVQVKHFLDSLTCLQAMPAQRSPEQSTCRLAFGGSVLDIGSGAGFPGLPLKIVCPEMPLTLLDSVAKKTGFLRHIVGRLRLEGVEIVTARAEEAAHDPRHRARYAVALSRAVAELPTLVEYALPFCQVGGMFIAQKSAGSEAEIGQASRAIELLGGVLREARPITVPGLEEPRLLVIVDKVQPTPAHYPRRPGMPSKRPILPKSGLGIEPGSSQNKGQVDD